MICCVMTAVVTWRSSDGASPIMPALSTPPMRGCSCAVTAGAEARRTAAASAASRMIMGDLSERLDVRAAFPSQGLERHLGLGAVLKADHHGLLEHAERAHLARHAPLPAAVAEKPAVRERHVLRLGHPDRDRVELLEIRGAAELPPAGTDPVHELGRVAR